MISKMAVVFANALLAVSVAHARPVHEMPRSAGDIADMCRAALRDGAPAATEDQRVAAATSFGYCYAYVQAVRDAHFNPGRPVHCIPYDVTPKDVVAAFVAQMGRLHYLEDEERERGVNIALQMAYPCPPAHGS